jgi:hypothetical protein
MITERYICDEGHTWTCMWDVSIYRTPFERQDCCVVCNDVKKSYIPRTARVLSVGEYREQVLLELGAYEHDLWKSRVDLSEIDQTEPCILWADGKATQLTKKKPMLRLVK